MSELQQKTTVALSWSFVEAVTIRTVQFAVGVILARLLLPEQFGLIGMLTIFIAVAQTLVDSGFGAALIQKKEITEKDINSIFYFNIVVSFLAAACLCVISPWIANFYTQPMLTSILRVMSLILVINAFGQIQSILLTREIDFKTQAKVSLFAGSLSGVIGVSMAWKGYGVWSLVSTQIANAVLRVVGLWLLRPWRPSWIFSIQSLRNMFTFGSKLLISGLLNTIFSNMYLIVIGKLFSAIDLGYYTRAKSLQTLPSQTLSGFVSRVAFPVFSSIHQDRKRLKRGMKKAITTIVLINFPMMIGLAVVARPLVLVLLTEKWLPCVPYLQVLCFIGLMYPLHSMNLNALQAMGRSDLFLRLEVIKKLLIILNIVITWRWGIMAMLFGQVFNSVLGYYLNAYYNKTLLNYSIWEQIGDLYPYLLTSLIMGGLVYSLNFMSITSPTLLLICQIIVGAVVYLLGCRLFKFDAYMNLQNMLLQKMSFNQGQ